MSEVIAVSYTHLDVYKRQYQNGTWVNEGKTFAHEVDKACLLYTSIHLMLLPSMPVSHGNPTSSVISTEKILL